MTTRDNIEGLVIGYGVIIYMSVMDEIHKFLSRDECYNIWLFYDSCAVKCKKYRFMKNNLLENIIIEK